MTYMPLVEMQEEIELSFSRKRIRQLILDELTTDLDMMDKIVLGIEVLQAWCGSESTYASKAMRKEHVASLDLQDVVETVYVSALAIKGQTTLNNFIMQLAGKLQFEENYQGLMAAGEIIAVLCYTDVYDLVKPSKYSSIYVQPKYLVSEELQEFIENSQYLPPSLAIPKYLVNNRSSGYRTIKGESLILGGKIHHHEENICLDVLNTMNSVPLVLNQEMLKIQQESESDLDVIEDFEGTKLEYLRAVEQQKANWELFLKRCDTVYEILADQEFYLTNKVDKRGRIYTQGYQVNIQGNSYQKACIDLARKEIVDIPKDFFGK